MPTQGLRTKYLRLAEELVTDEAPDRHASSHVVSRVRLSDVAVALGVSRAFVSRMWASEREFWDDLASYIAANEAGPSRMDVGGVFIGAETDESTIGECARRALNARQKTLIDDPWWIIRAALLGHPHDNRLGPLVAGTAASTIATIGEQWWLVLRLLDRVPTDSLTVSDLSAAMYCVADGLAIGGRLTAAVTTADIVTEPDEMPDAGRWSLLAYAAYCMLRRCTRPRRDDEQRADQFDRSSLRSAESLRGTPDWSVPQRSALDSGRQLFIDRLRSMPPPGTEEPIAGPLANVTVANLARRAGVSRQALYKLWPTQSELRIDLIHSLYQDEYEGALGIANAAIDAAMVDPATATVAVFERMLTWLRQTQPMSRLGYMVFAADFNDWRVKEVGRSVTEQALERYAVQISAMLVALRLQLREGVRPFHLAALTSLTAFGATRLAQSNPELLSNAGQASSAAWTPLAVVMNAFVVESTVPAPG